MLSVDRMKIDLKPCGVPDLDLAAAAPRIPAATYESRCRTAYAKAGCDWLVVYADREHLANVLFLTGFEPRFEEAILVLGRDDRRVLLAGNESADYAVGAGLPGMEVALCQALSLMGQDRSGQPSLAGALGDAGMARGDTVGLVGWKYMEAGEEPGYFVPEVVVAAVARVIGGREGLHDATAVLMHETDGLRAVVDVDQIAVAEWAGARSSAAVWRVLRGAQVGDTEMAAAARMGYAGEPLSCHVMCTSARAPDPVIGLASPTTRVLQHGDGITTAIGYWGGLACRAGLMTEHDAGFLDIATAYFKGLLAWYEAAGLGARGGDIFAAVTDTLAAGGLRSALNPGHLVSYDEWSNTPIRPDGDGRLASGMAMQVDIIPVPQRPGEALNCEDTIALADGDLRAELAARHPAMWQRIEARRQFLRDDLGITLKEEILPLSNTPLCLAPFWLAPEKLLAVA